MKLQQCQPGDMVFAKTEIRNDGFVPGIDADAIIAAPGTRGVIINFGHFEDNPDEEVVLVKFEDAQGELGPAVGCWPEELNAPVN